MYSKKCSTIPVFYHGSISENKEKTITIYLDETLNAVSIVKYVLGEAYNFFYKLICALDTKKYIIDELTISGQRRMRIPRDKINDFIRCFKKRLNPEEKASLNELLSNTFIKNGLCESASLNAHDRYESMVDSLKKTPDTKHAFELIFYYYNDYPEAPPLPSEITTKFDYIVDLAQLIQDHTEYKEKEPPPPSSKRARND